METSSPLLRLPVEIRFQIYSLVLPRSKRSKTCRDQTTLSQKVQGRGFGPFYTYVWIPGSMSLLAVNQQIRREALKIFFGSNVFNVYIDSQEPRISISYFRDPFNGEEYPSRIERQSSRARSNSIGLQRNAGLPTSQALLELRSVVQHGIELKELPKEHLALIQHVYVVVARTPFLSYQQGFPLVSAGVDAATARLWTAEKKAAYSAERCRILIDAIKTVHQRLGFSNRGECNGNLQDIEMAVFPYRNPWGIGCTIDNRVLEYIEWTVKRFGWGNKCKIRKLRPLIDSSHAINGFTDAPSEDEDRLAS